MSIPQWKHSRASHRCSVSVGAGTGGCGLSSSTRQLGNRTQGTPLYGALCSSSIKWENWTWAPLQGFLPLNASILLLDVRVRFRDYSFRSSSTITGAWGQEHHRSQLLRRVGENVADVLAQESVDLGLWLTPTSPIFFFQAHEVIVTF